MRISWQFGNTSALAGEDWWDNAPKGENNEENLESRKYAIFAIIQLRLFIKKLQYFFHIMLSDMFNGNIVVNFSMQYLM